MTSRPRIAFPALLCLLPGVPASAGEAPLRLAATGVQVYTCAAAGSGFAWRLDHPDAVLVDGTGRTRVRHGQGPTWRGLDGSTITGEVVATIPAPRAGAIPWLVARVSQRSGEGLLHGVSLVVRTDTQGGVAPADGCGAATLGGSVAVPYRASYLFVEPIPQG